MAGVLSPAVDIFDLDGEHLANWLGLLLPPGVGDGAEPRWAAVFLDRAGGVAHAVRAGRAGEATGDGVEARAGACTEDAAAAFGGTSAQALESLRDALGVDLVVVLADGGLARILGDIESQLRLDQDYAAQVLTALRAVRRAAGRDLWVEPRVTDLIPPLAPEPLQRTFELLFPGPSTLLAYVFDSRAAGAAARVHASVIAVVRRGEIELVTTHLGLADALPGPALARDWRRRVPRVLELVGERYAAPALGVFLERAAWERIVTGPADQLSRELAAGHVVLDPAPAWLRGLLGGAQLAAAASRGARRIARFVPPAARRAATDLARTSQERLRQAGAHPFALLGFDPIELFHRARAYYRPR